MIKLHYLLLIILLVSCGTPSGKKLQPADEVQRMLSIEQMNDKQADECENIIKDLISKEPENLSYKIYLGRLYKKLGKKSSAGDIFKEILEKEPNNSDAITEIINLYIEEKKFSEATKYIKQRISNAPKKSETIHLKYLLGVIQLSENNLEEAEKNIKSYLLQNNDDKRAILKLAYLFYLKKEYGAAKLTLVTYKNNENDADVKTLMGLIYFEEKNFTDSYTVFIKANQLNPDLLTPVAYLSRMYLINRNFIGAYEFCKSNIKKFQENPELNICLAKSSFYLRKYQEAIEYFLQVEKLYDDTAVLFNVALCFFKLKDYNNAEIYLQKHLKNSKKEEPQANQLAQLLKEKKLLNSEREKQDEKSTKPAK